MRYVALLRGINVSGQKMVKMDALKKTFEDIGFKSIKTYIQSGNVVFDYEGIETTEIVNMIEKKINDVFGFSVNTIVRSGVEIEDIIKSNPFIKEENVEIDKLHVTFLKELPQASIISSLELKKEEEEKFSIISKEVYLYLPNGYGRTKLNNNIFEKKLKTSATTRNWNTINKLLQMVKEEVL